MLRLLGNPRVLCDGLTRRDLLHIGGLGAFGVALHGTVYATTGIPAPSSIRRTPH